MPTIARAIFSGTFGRFCVRTARTEFWKSAAATAKGKGTEVVVPEDTVLDLEKCVCSATISTPLSTPKILMLELVESIASKTMLKHTPGGTTSVVSV